MKKKNCLKKIMAFALIFVLGLGMLPGTGIMSMVEAEAADSQPNYLTLTAQENGVTISLKYRAINGAKPQYSTNQGANWTDYESGMQIGPLNNGDSICFKGIGIMTYSNDNYGFTIKGKTAASGSVTSLTDGAGNDSEVELSSSCYAGMFRNCTDLISAPELPAVNLVSSCYASMFEGCSGLTSAPKLPATTLANYCYESMFEGCSGLTSAPELPATTLAKNCYASMFRGCSSLTSAPELPSVNLVVLCYVRMFEGCSNLTEAPVLPAEQLADYCYEYMFKGCTSLEKVPVLPSEKLADSCYSEMFSGCSSLIKAPELPATELTERCYNGMFSGCSSLAEAPVLPAMELAERCYQEMFSDCSNLAETPELPATELADYCYYSMFRNCTKLEFATALPAMETKPACYTEMFYGCTSLKGVPLLPATKLGNSCYSGMFQGCTSLSLSDSKDSENTLAWGIMNASYDDDWNYIAYNMFYDCNNKVTNALPYYYGIKMYYPEENTIYYTMCDHKYSGNTCVRCGNTKSVTVTIKQGSNMTTTSTNLTQKVSGTITDVIFTADEGYYFPEDYSVENTNGLTITRNSYNKITISGKPTADTEIVLKATSKKTKAATPNAGFIANNDTEGILTNVSSGMSYSIDGVTWISIHMDNLPIGHVSAQKGIMVRMDGSDTAMTSDIQKISVTQADKPNITKLDCSSATDSDGSISGLDESMEYKKSEDSAWIPVSGKALENLAKGTYDIRVKASGSVLASETVSVTIGLDSQCPAVSIQLGKNKWESFLSAISFGYFYRDKAEVEITASDDRTADSDLMIQYYLSDREITETEAKSSSISWINYTGKINLTKNSKQYVYAKATDKAGNTTVVNSQGIVIYSGNTENCNVTFSKGQDDDVDTTIDLNQNTVASVKVDMETVANKEDILTTVDGKLILKAEYLNKLSAGKHTITISYNPMGMPFTNAGYGDMPNDTTINLTFGKCITHQYAENIYTWSKDYSQCTAKKACTYCDENTSETVNATATVVQEADCTKQQLTSYTAEFADPKFKKQTLADVVTAKALGHQWDKGTEIKAPTYSSVGEKKYVCQVCNETKTEPIPMLEKKVYKVLEGDNVSHIKKTEERHSIRIDCPLSEFESVEMDGKVVDAKYYTLRSGSTIVTFTQEYMDSLSLGEHSLVFNFKEGVASTKVTVVEKKTDTAAKTDSKPDNKTSGTNQSNSARKAPKTGDNNPAIWMFVLLMAGGAGITAFGFRRKMNK